MSDDSAFDVFSYIQYVIVALWIKFCLIFYVFKISNKSASEPHLAETTPVSDFHPPSSPTPLPRNYEAETSNLYQSASMNEGSSCNPGKMTINPWLNFLRHFRTLYCGIRRQTELFQRASNVWRNMSDAQKEPFRLQAENVQSMRDSSSFNNNPN